MPRLRKGDAVVITGASSGIGRATAIEFAKKGSRLVLAARQIEKLEETAEECRRLGAPDVFCASVDVTDATAVHQVCEQTLARFGRINVWINNAGIGVIGSFTDVPLEEHRKVIETNVMGYMHGAYYALKVFKKQGSGVLINNASISSTLATPHIASYTASKFAIRGLTHSLAQDLAVEGLENIYVCQINPGVVDTPAFEHSSNYSGLPLKIRIPMVEPETIARKIVSLVERPRREIFVGPLTSLGSFAYALFPGITGAVLVWMVKRYYFAQIQNSPTSLTLQRGIAPPAKN
jgi:short-subunit dehydrogenase